MEEKKRKRKGLAERIKEAKIGEIKTLFPTNGFIKDEKIFNAYKYAETHRIRERIIKIIKEKNGKTLVFTGPKDSVGNTFLVCITSLNAAFFTDMNVLIVDANLRRPELHLKFGLERERGLTEVMCGELSVRDVIKKTDYPKFSVITAGREREDLSRYINKSIIERFVREISKSFDLIFFDTSPVLVNNRNNIDPSVLSNICDITFLTVLDSKTKKADLIKMVETIKQAGGNIGGILYNRYLSPPKISLSYILQILFGGRLKYLEAIIP